MASSSALAASVAAAAVRVAASAAGTALPAASTVCLVSPGDAGSVYNKKQKKHTHAHVRG
jgi:hypothetical protein